MMLGNIEAMHRRKLTHERRAEIILGLKLCMLESGYENASTKNIAMKINISPGLIHYHFRTKEEILLALLQDLVASADKRYQSLISSTTAPKVKLDFFIDSHLSPDLGASAGSSTARCRTSSSAWTLSEIPLTSATHT